jgi:inorganic triphosphatase YgiF
VKSIRTAVKRADSALHKLKKLIDRYSSNKLTEALKYIKAEFPNISYIT